MTDQNETSATGQAEAERPFHVRAAEPDRHGHPEQLHLHVDRIPRADEMRWRERAGLYVAEMDGYVDHLWHDPHGQGFNGQSFGLTMEDGSQRTLVGPMRGGAESVSRVFPEMGGVVNADASVGPDHFASGNCRYTVGITAAKAAEIHAQFPELAEQQRTAVAEWERKVAEYNARRQAQTEAER
jgi:hypothetical protein